MKNENNSSQKEPLKAHMEQLFVQMKQQETAPKDVKDKVFKTLDFLELVGTIGELFTGTLFQTNITLIDILNNSPKTDTEANKHKNQDKRS